MTIVATLARAVSLAILAATSFLTGYALLTLPPDAVLTVHWGIDGVANRFAGKEALLFIPLVALLVAAAAASWAMRSSQAASLTLLAAIVSLATCLVEVPQAWIGVAVNVGLLLATPLKICGEVLLPVHQCMMSKSGKASAVKKIFLPAIFVSILHAVVLGVTSSRAIPSIPRRCAGGE